MQNTEKKKFGKNEYSYNPIGQVGDTKAAAAYQDLKFDNEEIQRDIDLHDHVEIHERAIINKLGEYQDMMNDFCGYPPEVQLATATAIIYLDDQFGLEKIADKLDMAVQSMIFYFGSTNLINGDPKDLIQEVDLLQQVAKQFRWLASHGCRRF